ncbi:MAG: TetR/AcrR family transcriptional regulator [Pseudomonadota bacterium]
MTEIIDEDMSPAERRRQKVRQTILDAAERVFAEEGEAGLSIRRLADEIDYSPGAIYKYFDSKQELVDELKEAFFAQILDRGEQAPNDRALFLEYARGCLEHYIRKALERPHHYAAAFSGRMEFEAQPEDCAVSDVSNKKRAFEMLHSMVEGGVSIGLFKQDLDTYLASKSLWASSHGLALIMSHMPQFASDFITGPRHSEDQLIRSHAAFLIEGLTA